MHESVLPESPLPTADTALRGNDLPVYVGGTHVVLGTSMVPPWPAGSAAAVFGMGCFWGIERLFWRMPGVYTTAAGYAGGYTANPEYEQVCSGRTGHTEAVLVVYDPARSATTSCCGRSGRTTTRPRGCGSTTTRGSQYRSAIYTTSDDQAAAAERQPGCVSGGAADGRVRGDHHGDRARCRPSTTPRTTTSSTSTRTRAGTATCTAPALRARSPARRAWASRPADVRPRARRVADLDCAVKLLPGRSTEAVFTLLGPQNLGGVGDVPPSLVLTPASIRG